MNKQNFLFEVGTEVCHKVGGIYTILVSKLEQTVKNFGENYILIGPWRGKSLNKDLIERKIPILEKAKKILAQNGIECHTGVWNDKTKPKVILIKFKRRHKLPNLLDSLEKNFGIDQSDIDIDYIRCTLFSIVAGEAIEILTKNNLIKNKKVITHHHEWMCGAALLHLKKYCKNITNIFTTHATVLGRALAYENKLVSDLPKNFNSDRAARKSKYVTYAKHSVEKIAANAADYFTTVSKITAKESKIILGRLPDKIVGNGLDIKQNLKRIDPKKKQQVRKKLLQIASKLAKRKLDDNTLLWITSGRYEFHNKGYDTILKSLAKLEKKLPANSPPIVVFFLVALNIHSKKDSLLNADPSKLPKQKKAIGVATHKILHPEKDGIIMLTNKLGLKKPFQKIHVVFSDAYLNGNDGVFDLNYEEILAACDLSLFPSFYEPWGYTPLESLVYSVPTITSDLAGFGSWSKDKSKGTDAVFVLKRKGKKETETTKALSNHLLKLVKKSSNKKYVEKTKKKSFQIAKLADWKNFYKGYLESYKESVKK